MNIEISLHAHIVNSYLVVYINTIAYYSYVSKVNSINLQFQSGTGPHDIRAGKPINDKHRFPLH